ncbi:MAG: aspartate kinase [Bacteroidota bacterium]|nr:aspartate kinase [Bacteroidota bacterium]
MKVFKFGGASVKDAAAVKNVTKILSGFTDDKLVVIISAMGKTTNALEKVVNAYYNKTGEAAALLNDVKDYHNKIIAELFPLPGNPIVDVVNNVFVEVEWVLEEPPSRGFAFAYDQVVSAGELISTRIISAYLSQSGVENTWLDARDVILTDNNYREGNVNWDLTQNRCEQIVQPVLTVNGKKIITQGFIGSTSENFTTTLGREGSDYSAAIFAYCLAAEDVFIWKDVPGVLNADPKFYTDAQKLDKMSYHDAIELAYYGASVIHPKTIKPLENRNISLHVKSFMNPDLPGTVIGKDLQTKPLIPSFIFKENQMLLSISAKDFSFIAEDNLSEIFGLFATLGIKINLMQNSAISFSVCIDNDKFKAPKLVEQLQQTYKVLYNENLQLFTVRHYYPSTVEMLTAGKEILLEQRSRHTAQFVVRVTND